MQLVAYKEPTNLLLKVKAKAVKAVTQNQIRWMKILYTANIFWAGIPGFLITFFPSFAETNLLPYLFGSVRQDLLVLRILSSIWLAVGILSIFGLRNPLPFAAIFPIQILYKSS